jgi:phosphopantothenoylcysteine synthetase/decarboxylase
MHFLITAGGTREYIDPVRFISNASSGRMGYALAEAALKTGHTVTLISASDAQPPIGVDFVGVETAAEMFEAVKKFFHKCDCLIMAAAVSDYTPVKKSKTKIKKSEQDLVIRLKPTVDILAWAGKQKVRRQKTEGRKIIVGFALEDKDIRRNAEKKLKDKNLDMIIANKPEAIGADKSTVFFKAANGRWGKAAYAAKANIAKKIIKVFVKLPY